MSGRTARLATTQQGWQDMPVEANPYSESFSLEAARCEARARIEAAAGLLSQAGEAGADLAVTGEDIAGLSLAMGYLDDPTIFHRLTVDAAAFAHETVAAVAKQHRMHVAACFYEKEGERVFNSSVLFGRDGRVVGRYHKVHLPVYETWLVTPGDDFPAFETDIGVVGMLICYDDMWSESSACCSLSGARIICHSTAYSPPEYRVRTRAMDAQVFYITSTNTGSRICAPNSTVLADCGDKQGCFAIADADIAGGSLSPENFWEYLYSGIRDHRERHLKLRRPDAYKRLLDKSPPALAAYPSGGAATAPEAVKRIYEEQKTEYRRGLRGEPARYTWEWSEPDRQP
ncbi:MAG: carbon-nitrogen hydrolase family protein [Armatimonadota bacterium]